MKNNLAAGIRAELEIMIVVRSVKV